jgi:hypothetical protein
MCSATSGDCSTHKHVNGLALKRATDNQTARQAQCARQVGSAIRGHTLLVAKRYAAHALTTVLLQHGLPLPEWPEVTTAQQNNTAGTQRCQQVSGAAGSPRALRLQCIEHLLQRTFCHPNTWRNKQTNEPAPQRAWSDNAAPELRGFGVSRLCALAGSVVANGSSWNCL